MTQPGLCNFDPYTPLILLFLLMIIK